MITVAESSSRNGTYTDIVTATLEPVEANPSRPTPRDITVTGATLAAGWYRFTFADTVGEFDVLAPLFAGAGTRPSVLEVARLMPDRATADGGQGLPSFDDTTEPTDTAVNGLIDLVLDSIDARVPDNTTAEVERAARNVVALTTAILIETGYFGEQTDVNTTRVNVWQSLLTANEAVLDAASQGDESGGVRFGSITVISPTLSSWAAVTGTSVAEILP